MLLSILVLNGRFSSVHWERTSDHTDDGAYPQELLSQPTLWTDDRGDPTQQGHREQPQYTLTARQQLPRHYPSEGNSCSRHASYQLINVNRDMHKDYPSVRIAKVRAHPKIYRTDTTAAPILQQHGPNIRRITSSLTSLQVNSTTKRIDTGYSIPRISGYSRLLTISSSKIANVTCPAVK